MDFLIIRGGEDAGALVGEHSLAFLFHTREDAKGIYQVEKHRFELQPNKVKVIWANRETPVIVHNTDRQAATVVLMVSYSEIEGHEFDYSIGEFELDYRSKLLLDQIVAQKYKKTIRSFSLKSQLYELLYLQLEKISKQEPLVTSAHYDKVILARSIIDQDFTISYTIPELAKMVGTNEQYLKKFFKQYYNKTILQHTREIKMEYAQKLIMSGNYQIGDVARLIGYKHATHFTAAFKKHFGYNPNLLKYEKGGLPIK